MLDFELTKFGKVMTIIFFASALLSMVVIRDITHNWENENTVSVTHFIDSEEAVETENGR